MKGSLLFTGCIAQFSHSVTIVLYDTWVSRLSTGTTDEPSVIWPMKISKYCGHHAWTRRVTDKINLKQLHGLFSILFPKYGITLCACDIFLIVSQRLVKSQSETKNWTLSVRLSVRQFVSCLTATVYRIPVLTSGTSSGSNFWYIIHALCETSLTPWPLSHPV